MKSHETVSIEVELIAFRTFVALVKRDRVSRSPPLHEQNIFFLRFPPEPHLEPVSEASNVSSMFSVCFQHSLCAVHEKRLAARSSRKKKFFKQKKKLSRSELFAPLSSLTLIAPCKT